MTTTLQKKLTLIAKAMNVNFTLNDSTVGFDKIFSEVGLLPALARRADQLSSLCLGYGIGANFDEDEDTMLGVKVSFDDITPDVLRCLCITDVLFELVKSSRSEGSVPLDELMYD